MSHVMMNQRSPENLNNNGNNVFLIGTSGLEYLPHANGMLAGSGHALVKERT
jgi:hypothetical protein